MDIRDMPRELREQFIDKDILAKLPPQQADLLKRTMLSEEWSMAGLIVRNDELERENRRLKDLAAEAEHAIRERDQAIAETKAAESARYAAERVAEKERRNRMEIGGELEQLQQAIVQAHDRPSRLEHLRTLIPDPTA